VFWGFSEMEIQEMQKIFKKNNYNLQIRSEFARLCLQVPMMNKTFQLIDEILNIDL
jgi:hypothetical protein